MNTKTEKQGEHAIVEERLSIEVTTHCNFSCVYCFACNGTQKSVSLPLPLVRKILSEGYDIGYRHLHITGGEPLLWKGLFPALDCACSMGYQSVFLNTNGSLLTSAIARRLAEYDGISISVSLEGTEVLHETLRGNGTYRQTINGVEKALEADLSLSVFTLACRSLLPELFNFAKGLYKKYPDIDCLTLIQLVPANNGLFSLSHELLEPQDLLKFIHLTGALNLLGFKTRFLNNPLVNAATKLLSIPWLWTSQPLYKEGSLIVMANRDIRLSHSSKYCLGKYADGMLQRVLASKHYHRHVAPNADVCSLCRYQEICMESSMERPMERYWGIESNAHYCQEVLDNIHTWDRSEMKNLLYAAH